MKKLLLLLSLTLPFIVNAQTPIPNGTMELWVNTGTATEEPTEWNSNKTGTTLATFPGQTCFRESGAINVHGGTYSARITTTNYAGTPVNGVMTLGKVNAPDFTPANGYNETVLGNANFSETTTSVPDSIVFWAKYVPSDATDSARVSILIHDNFNVHDPQNANGVHVRAKAVKNFRTGGVYIRIAVPFVTVTAGVTPVYMLCTFTSSKTPGVGTSGTTLYIDDVSLVYNPATVTTGTISPLTYYVSASSGAAVTVPYTITGTFNGGNNFTAQLSNSAGSFASPTTLGSVTSTTAGSIAGTIPAGTASGTGYRIRVNGSNPSTTGIANTQDIQIVLVTNSIAPTGSQTLEAGTNGTALTVTETAGSTSREWKYSTTPGGPYLSFAPVESGTSYTPNFNLDGTYYVVCETAYPNGINIISNEVQINVVDNSVAPSGSQSLLVGVNGTTLNVTESPAGTAREWKFSTTPGGPYLSFAPTETGTSYIPNFASAGVYYVVCISTISTVNCTSNEVVINVGSATLATGSITGSPFEFSVNAPNASVNVPYVVSGPLNPGNIFTAQLSDATGSFASPVTIGTLNATGSGIIAATIVNTTLDGTGYRIRVISSNPAIFGSDNGTDLVVDQFDNSISPSATQNIMYGVNGTAVNVTESQSSTRIWKYATVPGGPYSVFSPSQTAASYTPNFATPGTYYVVAVSENGYNDTTVSNEVEIDVTNGTNLNTTAPGSTTYYLSPNSAVTDNVSFTSDIVFNGGNTFTAEMSDAFGSFASPIAIGTLPGTVVGTIPVNIPSGLPNGTGYRIRVTSSSPSTVGNDNGNNISVVQFTNSAAPPDSQFLAVSTNGNPISVTSTHPTGVTHEWKYKVGVGPFTSFAPTETNTTYTPNFPAFNTYYVRCFSVNMWNDTVQSEEIVIIVSNSGIEEEEESIATYWLNDLLWIDLSHSAMQNPLVEVINMSGQIIYNKNVMAGINNSIRLNIASGIYAVRITDGHIQKSVKLLKP